MILLGFWHCYLKSVSLRFSSWALGQLWVICMSPGCKSQHCALGEEEQQVPREEPVSPVPQSPGLPASSHCCSEHVQGGIASIATAALAYKEDHRPRRESDFPQLHGKPVAGGAGAPCRNNASHGALVSCTACQYQKKQNLQNITNIASYLYNKPK